MADGSARKRTALTYALSNAAADSPPERLAWVKCTRHFVERSIQDAKSQIRWDELQAQKYRAWEHHLALTILATWFIAQTKLEWAQTYPPRPRLATTDATGGPARPVGGQCAPLIIY